MGAIKLPIPVMFNGKILRDVSIKSIKTSVVADTSRVAQKGDTYRAIQIFVAGGLESIGDITDRQTIMNAVGCMPYKSAWYLSVKTIMQDEKDDGVEGLYVCPRCGEKKVCEFNEESQLDTRDFITDLKIKYLESDNLSIKYDLESPIIIKDEDGRSEEISSLEFEYPTLNHCSQAFNKQGNKDEIRLQLAVYVEALTKVNEQEIDRKFKSSFGMLLFEQMSRTDIQKLSALIDKFGMETKVRKICNKCGKEWDVNLNTANFFGSALLSDERS